MPAIQVRGIRQTLPSGYILGRTTAGNGPTELISLAQLGAHMVAAGAVAPGGVGGLPKIAAGEVLGNSASASAVAAGTTVTAVLDEAIGSTQGAILYRDSSEWKILAPGTSGQFLETQGASANPKWGDASTSSGTVTSITAGTGLTGGTITTSGTIALSVPVSVADGGTGKTSAGGAALDAISGFSSTGFLKRTGAGAYSFIADPLPVANGGTGLTVGTSGGVPYYSATTTIASSGLLTQHGVLVGGGAGAGPAAIAVGTTGQALVGATGANPAFGTLPVAGGGTGLTVGTSGGVPYYSATTTIASSGVLAANALMVGGGAGAAPSTIANGQLPATAANDDASTGNVGEYVSTDLPVASAVTVTTNATLTRLTSISLTAGDWDVTGTAVFVPASGSQLTFVGAWVSVNPSSPLPPLEFSGFVSGVTTNISATSVPVTRFSLSTTTTVYLYADPGFSLTSGAPGGSVKVYGFVRARRVR